RLRLRPGDHRAGRRREVPHRRDRGADAVFPGGVVRELRRLADLRPAHPLRALLVHAESARSAALAPVRQPESQIHAPAVTAASRLLEAVAAGIAVLLLVVLARGELTVAGHAFTRADEFVIALAVAVALRVLSGPVRLPALSPRSIAILGAGGYALVMGFIVVTRHLAIRTHALDLGYYVQVVWSLAAGYGPSVPFPPMPAWGDHFSPVLYLMVPLGWVAPGAIGLLIVQTLVLAAGALAVYGYARHRLGAVPAAAGLALLFVVNPSLH